MKKVIILASMLLMGQSSWAQIRDFQTTRLNSTAGAGVASILATEAAILNPASSAFFNGSTIAYQRYSTSLGNKSDDRPDADKFSGENTTQGIFLSDHDGPVKGGVAYIKQDENNYQREQIITHGAAAIGTSAAVGITYRYLQDTYPKEFTNRHDTSHQMSIGYIQVLDEKTIIGLTLVDPTLSTSGEERAYGGLQYSFAEKLTLIADVGTQFTKDAKEKYIWRGAVQLQLFDDFFFRVGKFYDNIRESKGYGWGVGWIGPRLGVEFAQKFSDQFGDNSYIYHDETLVDTSISAIIKF